MKILEKIYKAYESDQKVNLMKDSFTIEDFVINGIILTITDAKIVIHTYKVKSYDQAELRLSICFDTPTNEIKKKYVNPSGIHLYLGSTFTNYPENTSRDIWVFSYVYFLEQALQSFKNDKKHSN